MISFKNLLLISVIFIIAYFVSSEMLPKKTIVPQPPRKINVSSTPAVTIAKPSQLPVSNQSVVTPQPLSNSCIDGNIVRQNVKACSAGLECYSLTPMNERYCRLPDGTCQFFCTDK